MKVAIVGGTGSFGRALTERLVAVGYEVVIGSRDEQRASELAAVYGVEGKANADAVRDVDLVVLATKSTATLDTARDLADAIGQTPVLCVASDLRFEKEGVLPGRLGTSLAEEVAEILAGPGRRGPPVARGRPPDPPGRARPGRLDLRRRPRGEADRARARRPARRRPGDRRRPARERARARRA